MSELPSPVLHTLPQTLWDKPSRVTALHPCEHRAPARDRAGDLGSSEALKCSDLCFTNDIESSEWPLAPPRTQVCKAGTREREGDLQVCGDPSPLAILKQVDFPQESVVQSAQSKQIIEEKDNLCRDSKCGFSSRISLVFAISRVKTQSLCGFSGTPMASCRPMFPTVTPPEKKMHGSQERMYRKSGDVY